MSVSSLNSAAPASASAAAVSSNASRTERHEHAAATEGLGSTLAEIGTAVVDGASATVTFSSEALHALEKAGEAVVDGVEDLALGAWHAVQDAAHEARHLGEVVVDAIEDGAHEVAETAGSVAREIGHYALVGAQAVGEGVSEIASGGVMAAAAGGKTLMALV